MKSDRRSGKHGAAFLFVLTLALVASAQPGLFAKFDQLSYFVLITHCYIVIC